MTEMTVIEQWQFLAAFLPWIIGFIIRAGWSKRIQSFTAIAVYTAYGLLGAVLTGQFVGLVWDSAFNIVTSVMAVIIIGYTSYQTLWKAFPVPGWIEEKTGGDPLVEVTPRQNVA